MTLDEIRQRAAAAGYDLVPSVKVSDEPYLKAGDVIECRQIQQFAGDLYRPMTVLWVGPDSFTAQLVSGDFGEPGQNRMAFERSAKGRTWR